MRCDHVSCSICAFEYDIWEVSRCYALPWGGQLAMPQVHGWCHPCGAIRPLEALSEAWLEATEEWLAESEAQDPKRWGRFDPTEFHAGMRERLSLSRRLLEHRRALGCDRSACLRCRSTEVILPVDGRLPHPGCGGELSVGMWVGGGTSVAYRPHIYSPCGELIEVARFEVEGRPGETVPMELWGREEPPTRFGSSEH